ncbi:Smr/MutS family protein [Candidatus Cardinium hertigii]|uniref:Smr/MutS family protein n=1 Tax=Candidatus Cardinium hertigii TaxID=247481 RepID=UPI003D7CF820
MCANIAIGTYVRIKNQAAIGQVISISLDKVLIDFGKLHFYLPLQSVETVMFPSSIRKNRPLSNNVTIPTRSMPADPILDLHGFNKAQALCALEKFINHALLLGHCRLKIIHGQGKGILRSAVRNYLNYHPLVKRITLQSPVHCMAGMTIIEI